MPESLAESAALVVPGEEEVEEGNEGTLEFWSTAGVDGGGREGPQTMDSQVLVAIKSEIPEPRPKPFWRSSSRRMTIRAATMS